MEGYRIDLVIFERIVARAWSEVLVSTTSCASRTQCIERVQKRIAYWDKQNNDVPAPNCVLKVRGEIIKVEGL